MTTTPTLDDAARAAWADYVARVHERHDPACGWQHIGQLPRLTLADLGLCLKAHPDLLDDVAPDANALADSLSTGDIGTVREDLAASILTQLVNEVRRQLLADLQDCAEQCEIARDAAKAERMHMSVSQYAEWTRGTEAG